MVKRGISQNKTEKEKNVYLRKIKVYTFRSIERFEVLFLRSINRCPQHDDLKCFALIKTSARLAIRFMLTIIREISDESSAI